VDTERSQDLDWCRRLYEQKAAKLVLYGRALGLSHSESEDVLQETFVALLGLERRPDNPSHYCTRAFRNRALNFRRGLWHRLRRELESCRWFERDQTELPWEREAMRALEGLPQEQREVIVLKFWHRHTFEEIAGLVKESPNTVAGRYRYGIARIRNHLRENERRRRETVGGADALLDAAAAIARA
jgi:RNA polymerase sigma-70 factor (ECF subfamily)